MGEQKLWILVSEEALIPYQTLEEAVKSFSSLAEFLVKDGKIVCLTKNGGEKEEWVIESVPTKDIAGAVLKGD